MPFPRDLVCLHEGPQTPAWLQRDFSFPVGFWRVPHTLLRPPPPIMLISPFWLLRVSASRNGARPEQLLAVPFWFFVSEESSAGKAGRARRGPGGPWARLFSFPCLANCSRSSGPSVRPAKRQSGLYFSRPGTNWELLLTKEMQAGRGFVRHRLRLEVIKGPARQTGRSPSGRVSFSRDK